MYAVPEGKIMKNQISKSVVTSIIILAGLATVGCGESKTTVVAPAAPATTSSTTKETTIVTPPAAPAKTEVNVTTPAAAPSPK